MEHFYHEPQFGEDWFDYNDIYKQFIKDCPNSGHIIEIGSWKGRSSSFLAVEIINSDKQIRFDCIDTWLGTNNDAYHSAVVQNNNNQLYEIFLDNIAPVSHIITPIRKTSTEASLMYLDNSIDIIFIDADHSYNAVINDITLWLPKVKPGGILAGHDYRYRNKIHPGVKLAVDEILGTNFSVQNTCWIYKKNAP